MIRDGTYEVVVCRVSGFPFDRRVCSGDIRYVREDTQMGPCCDGCGISRASVIHRERLPRGGNK